MRFFQSFGHKNRRSLISRRNAHQQWWETAAEFPVEQANFPTDDRRFRPELMEYPASEFDPQGSYTGRPVDGEMPVQDADDL